MKILLVLNDPPYGTERSYNGLRLALNLLKMEENLELTVFLMGDAVSCAKANQNTPNGYYNVARMLKGVLLKGQVVLCGTCMDARGLAEAELVEGCRRGTLDDVTTLTLDADKVLVF